MALISTFNDMFLYLDRLGVLDSLIPFILIFTIVFAVFQKAKILGEGKKNFNVIIALVMAFAVVIPHVTGTYPPNADIVDIINQSLPQVSIVVVAIIMVLLMVGIFGGEVNWMGSSLSGWIAMAAFLIVLYIFGNNAGWFGGYGRFPSWLWFLEDPDVQALILIILVFGVIIWFITREDTEGGKALTGLQKFSEGFRDLFSGGKK